MNTYREKGYLFLQSYDLDEKEIRNHLNQKVRSVEKQENIKLHPYRIYINVVKNKDDKKLGYSYIWTDKNEIYNLFCSLNLDGSKRERYYNDPNWVKPEEKEISEEGQNNWALLAKDELDQICPLLKEELPPLVDINHYKLGDFIIPIGPSIVEEIGKNTIYSRNIDNWINEKILYRYFNIFEKDKAVYKNKDKIYNYPLINIRKNDKNKWVTIIFSPKYPFTASFLINVVKKIKIKHNDNEKLIFFSQSKK